MTIPSAPPTSHFALIRLLFFTDNRLSVHSSAAIKEILSANARLTMLSYEGSRPKFFVMENVPGIVSFQNGKIASQILEDFEGIRGF